MRIEIAGWDSAGLRCPDASVDLRRNGRVPAVALIQMPNGTGKTTTLDLLNATLSGSAVDWKPHEVRRYRRAEDFSSEGRFKATLLVDGRPLTIELILNYDAGSVYYKTTNPGSGGIVSGWHVPPSIKRFLTPQFLNLFVFDGEFASRLLDGESDEADDVVDALCQIYLLDDMSAFSFEHWERSAKGKRAKTSSGLLRLQKSRDRLTERHRDITQELLEAIDEISRSESHIIALEEKINNRISSVEATRENHHHALQARSDAEKKVEAGKVSLMSALRWPHAIHPVLSKQLVRLRDNLDILRLPENTSSQFFNELVNEDECICGRPIDDSAAQEIRRRAEHYLDADDAGVINALKTDIEQYAVYAEESNEESGHQRIVRLQDDLRRAVREQTQAEQEVRTLAKQLVDAGDLELEKWQKDLQAMCKTRDELMGRKRLFEGAGDESESDDTTVSLSLIASRIKEKNDQIAEIQGTIRLRKQTELIRNLLHTATKRARSQIKSELVTECNDRLSAILTNDPIRIGRIHQSLRLLNQEGASVGQTLAIGYTFLMSVLSRGQNDFPLVVDSPAGPLDEGVRRRIGRLLPELCTQFVGFTINTERAGFVDALEASVDEMIYLTLFRKTPGTRKMIQDLPEGRFLESANAILVDDRDYFFRFDVQDEEEDDAISIA